MTTPIDLPPHIAEYVLGLMSEDEAAHFEAQLKTDADLRSELVLWTENMVAMTDAIAPVAPPARVLQQIRAVLFNEATPKPWWQRPAAWLGGVAAAGAIAFAAVVVLQTSFSDPDDLLVASLSADDQLLAIQVAFNPDTGVLDVNRSSGAAAEGRALELWLIIGENAPVSLGVLPERAQGRLIVPDPLRGVMAGAVLAVSDEPLGGSPTGAPTGAVLLAGQIFGT